MKKFKVLSTKKITPELVKESGRNHIEITTIEFISVKSIHSKENEDLIKNWSITNFAPAVFTSANAVDSFQSYFSTVPLNTEKWETYCLSGRTKETLLKYFPGITILSSDEHASGLSKKIISKGNKTILFFCGNKRREELPSILKNHGITVHEIVLYETIEKPVAITDHFDGILFFSPSSVSSFFSLNKLDKEVICFAIGETTANAIKKYVSNTIVQSNAPSTEILIKMLNQHFQQYNKTND